jgi:hypothetical protein
LAEVRQFEEEKLKLINEVFFFSQTENILGLTFFFFAQNIEKIKFSPNKGSLIFQKRKLKQLVLVSGFKTH